MKPSRLESLALLVLALLPACTSPATGYRSSEKDPDVQLRALWETYESGDWSLTGSRGSSTPISDRASYEIEQLATEFPRHAPTLFAVASIAHGRGDREKASSYLDALFRVQPAHPEAGVLRSQIAVADGNLSAAERVLRQQIRYTPDHSGLHESLAAVLFLSGRRPEARAELELATRLGAPAARTAFNLGLLAEAEGEAERAKAHYQDALAAEPNFPAASSRLLGLRARAGEVVR